MSVIAVKVTPETITIGSDSIRVNRYTQEKLQFAKLREVNEMVIGSSGKAQESSLFFIFAETRQPVRATENDIVEFFSEFQDWARKKMGDNGYKVTNDYIIVFGGKAFKMDCFLVQPIPDFTAVGIGADFALTALYLGHTVEEAISVACEFSVYCERPVNIIRKKL